MEPYIGPEKLSSGTALRPLRHLDISIKEKMLPIPGFLAGFKADPTLPTPLYHQIFLHFRNSIADGSLKSGDILQSEMELAKALGVSRITMRRALDELSGENLIMRRQGRGTVVNDTGIKTPIIRGSFTTLLSALKSMGKETSVELLDVSEIVPPETVAKHLGLGPMEVVQRTVRVRSTTAGPFSYLVSFIPLNIARGYGKNDLATMPMLKLLERTGIAVTEAEQQFSAVGADPKMSAALGVELGAPLLKIERVLRDSSGKAVQMLLGHYRPDRYVYCSHEKAGPRRVDRKTSQI